MYRSRISRFLAAVLCFVMLALPAAAAEVEAGSVYCFGTQDFSQEPGLTGICITGLPDTSTGTLTLDGRLICSGDILTAQQAEQMTFTPLRREEDCAATLTYLPIYENHVAPCTAMTISIRGKADKAPIAEDFALETYKNIPNTGHLKASDPEQQPLAYTVTRQGKRGTVEILEDGSFTYTPKKNKVGVDSFTYTAADPAGNVSREATVTVTILKPTDAPQYTDTLGQDCRFAAEWMKHTGIFVGESLGDQSCFQPEKPVTRGEFVTMMVKALDVPTEEGLTYTGYTDEIPRWLQPYLAAAIRSGLTSGLPAQETFDAAAPITGGEAAAMLCTALDLNILQQAAATAPEEATHWAAAYVTAAREAGFPLEAEQPLSRAQAAQILYAAASAAPDFSPVI